MYTSNYIACAVARSPASHTLQLLIAELLALTYLVLHPICLANIIKACLLSNCYKSIKAFNALKLLPETSIIPELCKQG